MGRRGLFFYFSRRIQLVLLLGALMYSIIICRLYCTRLLACQDAKGEQVAFIKNKTGHLTNTLNKMYFTSYFTEPIDLCFLMLGTVTVVCVKLSWSNGNTVVPREMRFIKAASLRVCAC